MVLVIGTIVISAVLTALTSARVARITSWRSVAMIAKSTRSPRACVDFIWYCDRLPHS
jgi:hypothetical protein